MSDTRDRFDTVWTTNSVNESIIFHGSGTYLINWNDDTVSEDVSNAKPMGTPLLEQISRRQGDSIVGLDPHLYKNIQRLELWLNFEV